MACDVLKYTLGLGNETWFRCEILQEIAKHSIDNVKMEEWIGWIIIGYPLIDQILLTCSLFSYTAFDLPWRVKYFHLNSPSRGLPAASPQWRTRIIALSILDLKTLREGKEAVLKKLKNLRPVLRIPHSSNSIAVECSFISFWPTSILLCYRVKSTRLASADGSMFNMVLLHDSLMTFILFCFCRHEKLMRRWPM